MAAMRLRGSPAVLIRTAAVAGACALVGVTGLTACTGSASHARDGAEPPGATGSNSSAGPPPAFAGVQHPLPSGSALQNVPGLYQQIRLTGCTATATGWQGLGTAHNTAGTARTYRILVLFTDAQARAVDSASTTVTVPAGTTGDWVAGRDFTAPEGIRCVVRAVRAA